MRALELVKQCCCALNCTISTQKTKNVEKYPERTNVRCFPIVQDSEKRSYAAEIPERERRMRWIATCSCRLDSLIWFNVRRHTRICSIYFEGGLGSTKLNPVPSIFTFRQHHRWKPPKSRTDSEERRRRHEANEKKHQESIYFQRKSKTLIRSKEGHSALKGANTPYCRPVYLEVPTLRFQLI